MIKRMKSKKAIYGGVMIYVMGLLILGGIIILGFSSINGIFEKVEETRFSQFKDQITTEVNSMVNSGRTKYNTFALPKYAGQIYIFDSAKPIPEESYNHSNAMFKDTVEQRGKHNIFLMEKGVPRNYFTLENVDIPFPYYRCYNINNRYLELEMRGNFESVSIEHLPELFNTTADCTNYSVERIFIVNSDPEDIKDVVEDIESDENMSKEITIWEFIGISEEDLEHYVDESNDDFVARRTIRYDPNTGKTDVNIRITSEGGRLSDFYYIEELLKSCVRDLTEKGYEVDLMGSGAEAYTQRNDPIMMWKFSEIDEHSIKNIHYSMDGDLSECLSLVTAFGFSLTPYDDLGEQLSPPPIHH